MSVTMAEREVVHEKVATAYEKRVNPSFWDLLRSRKRKQEFQEAMQAQKAQTARLIENDFRTATSEQDRKQAVVSSVIGEKRDIERLRADKFDADHPKRGKIATWFAERGRIAKGAMSFVNTAYLEVLSLVPAGLMLNKLGRTNTDENQEIVRDAQSATDARIRNEIWAKEVVSAQDGIEALEEGFEAQISEIREPIAGDARAVLIGGLGGLALNWLGAGYELGYDSGIEAASEAEAVAA